MKNKYTRKKTLILTALLISSFLGTTHLNAWFGSHWVHEATHAVKSTVHKATHAIKHEAKKAGDAIKKGADAVAHEASQIGHTISHLGSEALSDVKKGINTAKKRLAEASQMVLSTAMTTLFGSPQQAGSANLLKTLEGPSAEILLALLYNEQDLVREAMRNYLMGYLNNDKAALQSEVDKIVTGHVPGDKSKFYQNLFSSTTKNLTPTLDTYSSSDPKSLFGDYGKGDGDKSSAHNLTLVYLIAHKAFLEENPSGSQWGGDFKAFLEKVKPSSGTS